LISALKAAHASQATTIEMDTDHPFSDHRIELESVILRWLQAKGSESAK